MIRLPRRSDIDLDDLFATDADIATSLSLTRNHVFSSENLHRSSLLPDSNMVQQRMKPISGETISTRTSLGSVT